MSFREPSEMERRLAAADTAPVTTDAPDDVDNPVPYDPGLQADLLEHGPAALAEFGMIVVRDVRPEARYNSAVWYALAHDLEFELRDGVVVITDPKA
jgi:hypothetical protein